MSFGPQSYTRHAYASGADTGGSGLLKARPSGPPNGAITEENPADTSSRVWPAITASNLPCDPQESGAARLQTGRRDRTLMMPVASERFSGSERPEEEVRAGGTPQ